MCAFCSKPMQRGAAKMHRKPTILDNLNEKLRPPLPYLNDAKSGARFRAGQSVIREEGGLISHFILSKIVAI